jgi:F0F1-type ATP synthase membrane subunit c/vacuolar-type H+-ATPase subunit K
MLSPALRNLIAPQARVLTIIWFAFLATCPFYGFLAYLIASAVGDAEASTTASTTATDPQILTVALAAVSVVVVAVSFFYQRHAFSESSLKRHLAGPVATAADPLPADEQRLAGLLPYYQTSLIVVWAMRESVAVFGLVLTILHRDPVTVVPFAVAALVLLAMAPPRVVTFLEGARKLARRTG